MSTSPIQVSFPHRLIGLLLLVPVVLFNPLTVALAIDWGWITVSGESFVGPWDYQWLLPLVVDLGFGVTGVLLLSGRSWKMLWRESVAYHWLLLGCAFGLLIGSNGILPGFYRIPRLLLVLAQLVLLTRLLRLIVIRPARSAWFQNLGLSLYSFLAVMLILEGVFMFVVQPHRFNGTLASRAWFARHWYFNSEGYRDAPVTEADRPKRKLMVLGDSFAAGHGVDEVSDRFGEQLGTHLAEEWRVYNLGLPGSDVHSANRRVRDFPYSPDLLLYAYYPNDIQPDGTRVGFEVPVLKLKLYRDLPAPLRFLFRRSYLLNYFYWRFPHEQGDFDYTAYLDECYRRPDVWGQHRMELDRLVGYADSLDIPMAVVVFPLLENVSGSQAWTDQVGTYFRDQSIPVLDVAGFVEHLPVMDRIVNAHDTHPSAALHREVGDSLAYFLEREGLLRLAQ